MKAYIDYEATAKLLKQKPGVWHRIFIGEKVSCVTIRWGLARRGVFAKVVKEGDLHKVVAFWPDW